MTSVLDVLAGTEQSKEQLSPNGVQVIPYNASLDPQAMYFLPWFWNRLKEDGLVSLYYPGAEETGFSQFVQMMSGGARIALVIAKNDESKPSEAIGFVSWEPMALGNKMTAIAGFIFLKKFWDHKYSTDAANEVMKYWAESKAMDIAIGVVAASNLAAMRFLKRIGWQHTGTIPKCQLWRGEISDAELWCWERPCLQQ